jgi:hypothetical protein
MRRMAAWMRGRYRVRYAKDNRVSAIAAGSVALFATAAMSLAAAGMPTGLGIWLDQLLFLTANGAGMWLACYVLPVLMAFFYLPLPRRLTAITLYAAFEVYFILYFADFGIWPSIAMSVLYAFVALGLGLGLGWLLRSRLTLLKKLGMGAICAALLAVLPMLPVFPGPAELPIREDAAVELPNSSPAPVPKTKLDNPSLPGVHPFHTLSYGSGNDRHRALFGDGADLISESVDASSYITSWSKRKTAFWGFDEHRLPLNGRVWVPEGEGPFPLVLMVHGNHIMEYFSDGGYGYLGELLASRGMIAVSVDANFMNYSVWSSLPNDDMKMRAWLLLQHLAYLHELGGQAGETFADGIDWRSVALIGHSRGGQAVAMAADAARWFEEDDVLAKLKDVRIQSVIAIAPTDKRVDEESAQLRDVNYLTLQGAMDADVNNFYGDRQYNRVSFSGQEDRFKAELYLSNANHSQFNTDWGSMDERLPGGLFLHSEELMDDEDQRLVAKTYIGAFLEATLRGRSEYIALFQDYRSGSEWLPRSTRYVNRYESSAMLSIEDYEGSSPFVSSETSQGMEKEETTAKDRDGNGRGTNGMLLEWSRPDVSYTVHFREAAASRLRDYGDGSLLFSLANSEWQIEAGGLLPPLPDIELTLSDVAGRSWSVLLNEIVPFQPPSYTAFMRFGWLEGTVKDKKYKAPAEAVFQSFVIPLDAFRPGDESGDRIKPEEIAALTFEFRSAAGRVMVDDIGFMKQGGTYVEYESTP